MKAVSCRDYGEKFADRYLIIFDSGDIYYMSSDADMPNGCCIYAGTKISFNLSVNKFVKGYKRIPIEKLPIGTRRQISYLEGARCT